MRRKWKTKPATAVAGETSDPDETPDSDEPVNELEPAGEEEPAPASFTLSVSSGRSRVVSFDYGQAAAVFRAGQPWP